MHQMTQATKKKKMDVRAMKMIKSMDMMRLVMGEEYRRLGMGMSIYHPKAADFLGFNPYSKLAAWLKTLAQSRAM